MAAPNYNRGTSNNKQLERERIAKLEDISATILKAREAEFIQGIPMNEYEQTLEAESAAQVFDPLSGIISLASERTPTKGGGAGGRRAVFDKTRQREVLLTHKNMVKQQYAEIMRQATARLRLRTPNGFDATKAGTLCMNVQFGMSQKGACASVGITSQKYHDFKRKAQQGLPYYVLLFGLIELAEARLEERVTDSWMENMDLDWHAASTFLARRHSDRGWSPTAQQHIESPDLSKLSDDELEAIVGGAPSPTLPELVDDSLSNPDGTLPERPDELLAELIYAQQEQMAEEQARDHA
jgi:hypothetical protein